MSSCGLRILSASSVPRRPVASDIMAPGTLRTARYARAWINGNDRCVEEELLLDRAGTPIPSTLIRPTGIDEPLPAWVVLHGITRRGRSHAQLSRFTRAIVSTGAVAIVPEVPEWREFSLAPHWTPPTIRAGIAGLRESGWARDAPVGVVGFSFGAPHAMAATGCPDLREEVAGSVSFGGYCDLGRTVRFLMTGTHEWNQQEYRLAPDPYGRWIVGANYVTSIPQYQDAEDVARALRALAAHAGDSGIPSGDPRMDPRKLEVRASVKEEHLPLFDLFAPASSVPLDVRLGSEMAEALVEGAQRVDPQMEVQEALGDVVCPVHLLHGRRDHLIPFSESHRLREALPANTPTEMTITRLFGHSAQDSFPSIVRAAREVPAFFSALRKLLKVV